MSPPLKERLCDCYCCHFADANRAQNFGGLETRSDLCCGSVSAPFPGSVTTLSSALLQVAPSMSWLLRTLPWVHISCRLFRPRDLKTTICPQDLAHGHVLSLTIFNFKKLVWISTFAPKIPICRSLWKSRASHRTRPSFHVTTT